MLKKLTPQQVEHYREKGFVSPVEGLSAAKAAQYRRRLEATEQALGPIRKDGKATKPHLLFTWASELAREPAILDAVEDLIGPNIMIYQLTVFPKDPGDQAIVSWHQDGTYFHLKPAMQVAAWIALSDASIEAGCMEVVPGSHRGGQRPHHENKSPKNLLAAGQTVSGENEYSNTEFMPLTLGQFSLHHTHLIHRSAENNSADRRIGFSISYIPAHCRCVSDVRIKTSLVRGVDEYGHFDPEIAPKADYDENARAAHAAAMQQWMKIRTAPKMAG